jgi:hypothetical protein
MKPTGNIIRDAREPCGNLVSNPPPDLREHHQRSDTAAVKQARSPGWDPGLGDDD